MAINQNESAELPDIPLDLLRRNDAAAWVKAQRILWERIWRAVHRKMPFATEAELTDLVSEILCDPVVAQLFEPESDAFRNLQSFADLVNLACHIAGLRAIDRIRQSARRGDHTALDSVPESAVQEALASSGSHRQPEDAEVIQFALSRIDEKYQEPLLLHYFHGLGTQEIAEQMGIPKGSVCTLLSRGREALRPILESEGLSLQTSAS